MGGQHEKVGMAFTGTASARSVRNLIAIALMSARTGLAVAGNPPLPKIRPAGDGAADGVVMRVGREQCRYDRTATFERRAIITDPLASST
jgi:hypothetical protein